MDDLLSLFNSKWEDIINYMKNEYTIPKASVDTWLRALRPFFVEQASASDIDYMVTILIDEARVGASSKDYITTRYGLQLKCAIEVMLSCSCELSFLLDSETKELAPALPSQEEDFFLDPLAPISAAEFGDASFLNPRYTFDTFVVGPRTSFVYAAALAVAETPAMVYNPLFIYGGVGLGKTHLMHSIAHFILETRPSTKVLYVSSETFTNELVTAIRTGRTEDFQRKYREVDVLLIDDIQFVIGKESTQEEFFHTFNTLKDAKKQIVISSDRPPRDMETLEERLRSRFAAGLIADVGQPDYETRMAILKKKNELDHLNLANEDVFQYIASNVTANIRELEGALTKVVAWSRLKQRPITLDLAEEALKDLVASEEHEVTVEEIMDIVADHYSITTADILSGKRSRNIAYPRQITMYLCRKYTTLSLDEIGELMGNRDHSTIMHGISKIKSDLNKNDEALMEALVLLDKKISV